MTVITTIDELRQYVGEELSVSGWMEITRELVNTFADATGDHQWIHVDVERARRESPFGGTIAHGYLTLALHFPPAVEGVDVKLATRLNVNYGLNEGEAKPAMVSEHISRFYFK